MTPSQADNGNDLIRSIVVSTAVVGTLSGAVGIAGSTDGLLPLARFNAPTAVALDASGTVALIVSRAPDTRI